MFYTQVLRSTAAAARATSKNHNSQSWAVSEAKRLTPAILGWGGFLAGCLGWPFAIKHFMSAN